MTNTDLDTYNIVTVDTTSDAADGNTGSIGALMANKGADGKISLREAITAANNTANGAGGPDRIAFAIPISDPNYEAGRGVFTLSVATALPSITEALTLDGTTQGLNIGDTTPGSLGTGGTVGADALALSQVARPEIEIRDAGSLIQGFVVNAADVTIRGFAIYGFDNQLIFANVADRLLVEGNFLGSAADVFADPGVGNPSGTGVYAMNSNAGIIRNNLIGYTALNGGVVLSSATAGWLIENNEFQSNGLTTQYGDAVALGGDNSTTTVRANLLANSNACGVDLFGASTGATVVNNTITGSLNSTAGTTFGVEFFASMFADPTGYGEGERYLGFAMVTTDGSGNATINATLSAAVAAGDQITATATNQTTRDTSEFAQDITATAPNSPPTITSDGGGVTAAILVAENGTAVTTVTATDPEAPPQTLTFSISGGADAARFSINASTGELTFLAAPDYETPTDAGADNVYDVTVQVSDGAGGTDSQVIRVTVTDANDNAPTIPAGQTFTLPENSANGTNVGAVTATDVDTVGSLQDWTITGGTGAAAFAINPATGQITVANSAQLDFETTPSFTLTLTVSDGVNTSAVQTVTINLTDVSEGGASAIADTDAAADQVSENVAVGTAVGVTALATDPDGTDSISYSLDDNAGRRFAIDPLTGVVTTAAALDAETATSHNITVRATSTDTSFSTRTFTIAVLDVNEFTIGAITDSAASANSAVENSTIGTTVGLTASATDPDATATVTYSLDDNAGGRFAIDANTGVVTVAGPLDYEASTSHNVTVRATSSDGSFSIEVFTISVSDVNETPSGISLSSGGTVAENAANGTVVGTVTSQNDAGETPTYTLLDNAGGRFAIDSLTGQITVANGSLLNFEDATSHNVTVQVDDNTGNTATQTLAINLTNVPEPPTNIGLAAGGSVAENAANGSVVGTVTSQNDAGETPTYALLDNAGGRFAIDPGTGQITVADSSLLNFEDATSHNVTVQVDDGNGNSATQTFTIGLTDVAEPPKRITLSGGTTVPENSATGAVVGTVTSQNDAGETPTYTLLDNAGGRFAIDPTTGQITVADGSLLNYEAATRHNVTVQVDDGNGNSATQTLTINLANVNEVPVAQGEAFTTNQLETLTVSGLGLLANDGDVDGDRLTVVLVSDVAHGRLVLHSDGSFSYTPEGVFSGTDRFTYVAFDGALASAPVTVTITTQASLPAPPGDTGAGGGGSSGSSDTVPPGEAVGPPIEPGDWTPRTPKGNSDWQALAVAPKRVTLSPDAVPVLAKADFAPVVSSAAKREETTPVFLEYLRPVSVRPARVAVRGKVSPTSPFRIASERDSSNVICGATLIVSSDSPWPSPEGEGDSPIATEKLALGATAMVTTALSAGYVTWLLRSGSLVASLLAVLPAWQSVDPLPILESFEESRRQDDGGEDLQSIVG